jgi:hypothetical protein
MSDALQYSRKDLRHALPTSAGERERLVNIGASSISTVHESISSIKAYPAGFRATPQLTHLALSGASIRRKRHKNAMGSVMDSAGALHISRQSCIVMTPFMAVL